MIVNVDSFACIIRIFHVILRIYYCLCTFLSLALYFLRCRCVLRILWGKPTEVWQEGIQSQGPPLFFFAAFCSMKKQTIDGPMIQ